ncbi:SDR family oxidoreductase [Roseomonas sp. OT10]|uniref:SDR family NAD(P)-dependent oxidoreductase n=1 Tax=Roseomonas cutis TaxID=2897332 RepID=UPI001E35163A|nr:SDR family NAD(P)-dependent oxidoreductase [Roseomonas sp. OT10]UFN49962.1 SDR family oxidoreductase [Roseomonas sp. OT10]
MRLDFSNQVVAVTGAGTGFGRAIARSFAALGARVFATDVKAEGLAETAAGQAGIATAVVDLTDRAAAAAWIAAVEREAGAPVAVLVNNAGGTLFQTFRPIDEVADADWDRIFAVNVDATFVLCRAAAPGMKRAGRGRIVNISSTAALKASRTRIQAYASAKHAVIGLTRQLAQELGPHGITVNSVAPGLILTDEEKRAEWEGGGQARRDATLAAIPLGHLGEAQDIADAVLFFASPLAKFVSGQVLPVNGGSF